MCRTFRRTSVIPWLTCVSTGGSEGFDSGDARTSLRNVFSEDQFVDIGSYDFHSRPIRNGSGEGRRWGYAALRKEPPGLTVNANSVFIISSDHVVVVDATLTPGTAREVRAAQETDSQTGKYVINTTGTMTTSWETRFSRSVSQASSSV